MASGVVETIHIAPERAAAVQPVERIAAHAGRGLEGDRKLDVEGAADITLIEAEALESAAADGIDVTDGRSRRQVTTRGIDLGDLVGARFRVGEIECEGEERCEPCSYLAKVTGEPGVLRGLVHTGLEAKIVRGGEIAVGDEIEKL